MAIERPDAVIQALFDRFNQRDLDGAVALVSEDFELQDMGAGLTLHGPEGLRQWFSVFLTAGPDAHASLKRLVVDGEWVASEHVGTFTHTGPLLSPSGEVPPSGRPVEIQMAEIYQVTDGNLRFLRAYYDMATMLRQLALLPESQPAL